MQNSIKSARGYIALYVAIATSVCFGQGTLHPVYINKGRAPFALSQLKATAVGDLNPAVELNGIPLISSPLTTKGDIFTFSTTNDRLPVGADGLFLMADSAEPTGLAWASVSLANVAYTNVDNNFTVGQTMPSLNATGNIAAGTGITAGASIGAGTYVDVGTYLQVGAGASGSTSGHIYVGTTAGATQNILDIFTDANFLNFKNTNASATNNYFNFEGASGKGLEFRVQSINNHALSRVTSNGTDQPAQLYLTGTGAAPTAIRLSRPGSSGTAAHSVYTELRGNSASRFDINSFRSTGQSDILIYNSDATYVASVAMESRLALGTLAAASSGAMLQMAGTYSTAFSEKGAAYTLTDSDGVISGDATAGAFNVTLPTAIGRTGTRYTIKKVDASANAVSIVGTGGQLVDGAAILNITSQYGFATVCSNGSHWIVIASHGTTSVAGSPLTTKGDIYTYSTGGDRLPLGTTGQVLVPNAAEATGLDWSDNLSLWGALSFGMGLDPSTDDISLGFGGADTEYITHLSTGKFDFSSLITPASLGTGTADSTTFLRGDGTWSAAGGQFPDPYITFGYYGLGANGSPVNLPVSQYTAVGTHAQAASPGASGYLMLRMTTPASINGEGSLSPASSYAIASQLPDLYIHMCTGSDVTNVRYLVGGGAIAGITTGAPTTYDCGIFRYSTDLDGTAFWRIYIYKVSTATTVNFTTTVAVTANTEYKFRIKSIGTFGSAPTSVEYYINDVLVYTDVTNMIAPTSWQTRLGARTAAAKHWYVRTALVRCREF